MDTYKLKGGRPLRGELHISGSKNACLPLLIAALLSDEPSTIRNVPTTLRDIIWMKHLMEFIGARVEVHGNTFHIDPRGFEVDFVTHDIMKRMRASMYAMGPMVARLQRARVSLPGGCNIGSRPVDVHLRGFHALGCRIIIRHGFIHARNTGLHGATVSMKAENGIPSVGATCNVMMAASLAHGESILTDAAAEPEVVQLGEMLNQMGAHIEGLGTNTLRIRGAKRLSGANLSVIPDRIETATYMIAAAITGGEVVLRNAAVGQLDKVIEVLREMGITIEERADGSIYCANPAGPASLRPVSLTTEVYPGFPTDVQAPLLALLALVPGESTVTETIYHERFMHIPELVRLGATMRQEGSKAIVQGVAKLTGAPVMATDLRASVSLVLAGLAAEGETTIARVYHLDRGYERLEEKFAACGADIERIKGGD